MNEEYCIQMTIDQKKALIDKFPSISVVEMWARMIGIVPPDAITAAVEFDPSSNHFISFACIDPMISIDNHMYVGDKYRALTRWFFEDDVDPKDICFAAFNDKVFEAQSKFVKERKGLVRLK